MARPLALLTLLPVLAGCGVFATDASPESPPPKVKAEPAKQKKQALSNKKRSPTEVASKVDAHLAKGDFVVQRFSGAALSAPIELTERIVEVNAKGAIIDYRFEQAGKIARFRAHFRADRLAPERVFRLEGEREIEESPKVFEAWMQKTVFAADSNEGVLGKEDGTCLVGKTELDCHSTSYRVYIGDDEATLTVTESDAFARRDVAGRIVDASGRVLYDVRVVEAGNDASEANVAQKD